MGHCPWTLFTQRWVQCAQLLFSNACDVLRMYSCPACVGGWPFWWQLGLWVRGWESSMSTLWTDHFTPRIFVLLAFPSPSILAVSPPSMLGREYITYLPQIFGLTVPISQHPFMNVLIIGGSSWFITVSHECVCVGGRGLQKLLQWRGDHEPILPLFKSTTEAFSASMRAYCFSPYCEYWSSPLSLREVNEEIGEDKTVSRGHYFVRSWHEVDFSKRSSEKILVSVYFENKGPDCKRQSRRAASQRSLNGSHRLSDLPDFHCKWK